MWHAARCSAVSLVFAVALAGCGSSADTADDIDVADPSGATDVPAVTSVETPLVALEGVTGELVLTRQRDLLDRGLINVLVDNQSAASMLVSDIALVADSFSVEPSSGRTISVRSGRRVAIQVPYGVADDCATVDHVDAELEFSVVSGGDPKSQRASIELGGTDLLDAIRAEQCTTRRFNSLTNVSFANTAILDGDVITDLIIEPTGTDADLVIEGVSGTVLVGVRLADDRNEVSIGDEPVAVPLAFVVNRCDPHAMAEVTKRFGLDLEVSIDGAEPVSVGVDIGDLVVHFESAVEQCAEALDAD
jgi:hypothetical protein